jgi:predicted MFS family arabinose efflux permease
MAVAALALAAFALNLNTNVLGALLPFVRADFALAAGEETQLVAAAAAGSAIGALCGAPFAARFGRRRTFAGGLIGFLVASALHLAVADRYVAFLSLRVVSGFAVGLAYATASALVAEVAPYARRGAAMGWFSAGLFLAIPVGMPLIVWLANAGHWPAIFGVQAVVAALGCWWAFRTVPDRGRVESRGAPFAVLSQRAVAATLIATMLHVGSFFTTVQLATTWLDETGRVAKEEQVPLWVALGLLSVIGSMVFGRISDRVGKRLFVLATSAVLVAGFALVSREPGDTVLAIMAGVLAVTASARTGPLQALLSGFVPADKLGAVMGLRGCAMQLGVVGFALAAGPVSVELGFRGVLMLAAGCQLGSYVAIRFWAHEPGRGTAAAAE